MHKSKWILFIKQAGLTGVTQGFVQLFSLVSGILIIRLLPTDEYALYTLANTMLGTMTILADGGIGTAVFSLGGKHWKDKERLGTVMSTGLKLRNRFAIFSLLISIPVLGYLLLHHGASGLTTALIILSLIPAFLSALSDSLFEIVPKLHQDIGPLQRNQFYVSFGRFFLTVVSVFVFPWAFIGILAAGIPRAIGNIKLRKLVTKFADLKQSPDRDVEQHILQKVKLIMPGAIYYCLSGQISLWLISFLGSSASLAEIGALGRITMVLTVVNVFFATMVIPRFSRLNQDNFSTIKRKFIESHVLIVAILVSFIFFVVNFDNQILSVLGSGYSGLQYELQLSVLSGSIMTVSGVSTTLIRSRGHIINPWLSIGFSLTSVVSGVLLFDVATLVGVLYFNIWIAVIDLLVNFGYATIVLKKNYN